MSDFPVTVFHNPACGTSRNTVAMVREAGLEPEVVEYLKTGWTRPQLEALLAEMDAGPREVLRAKAASPEVLALDDDALLDAMVADPVLVERPIVVTPKGTKLCRPSETVLELLDRRPGRFVKEDGEVVI